ncbi:MULTISPECIES: glycosyltransferase [unclassified Luteimonas]
MTRPRIALVTPNLPVPHDLARGRYIHETARALSRLADVRVYFPQVRHPRLPGLAPRTFLGGIVDPGYSLDGIDLEPYTYPGFPGLSRASNGFVGGRALAPRLRRFAPDIVLGYWIYPDGNAALRAARALGVPCIVGARGSDIHMRSGMAAWLTRKTLHGADAVLTVSQAMRRAVISDFGVDACMVSTIVNGVDTAVFHPRDRQTVRRQLGIDPAAKLVTYVGRLVESKGMHELLEAFAAVHVREPNAMLGLVGDGVMRERLARMVAESGLAARVRMTGGLEPLQVAEWIAASNVLTLPSWSEGYPNVLVEALACGCPVVATDVGGAGEIVASGSGILVPARDPARLAQALDEALARSWDHASIARAMARSWDDVARETFAACADVLAAHAAGLPGPTPAGPR